MVSGNAINDMRLNVQMKQANVLFNVNKRDEKNEINEFFLSPRCVWDAESNVSKKQQPHHRTLL